MYVYTYIQTNIYIYIYIYIDITAGPLGLHLPRAAPGAGRGGRVPGGRAHTVLYYID